MLRRIEHSDESDFSHPIVSALLLLPVLFSAAVIGGYIANTCVVIKMQQGAADDDQ